MASRNRGKPKPKLRDLSRAILTLEEQNVVSNEFIKASPISAAILGAVMVEYELDACLRRKFPRISDDDWAEMLEDHGPLRSLHAKIVMGHALHVYGEATRDNLHIVRSIRNAFAHSKRLIDFDHELIVAELCKIKQGPIRKRMFSHLSTPRAMPSTTFVILCYAVAGELIRKQHTAMQARVARSKRKSPVPFLNLLSGLEGSPSQEAKGSSRLSSPANQTGDPSPVAPRGLLDGLHPYFEASKGSADKK